MDQSYTVPGEHVIDSPKSGGGFILQLLFSTSKTLSMNYCIHWIDQDRFVVSYGSSIKVILFFYGLNFLVFKLQASLFN